MPHSSNRWAESIKSREKFQNDTLYGFEKLTSIYKVKVENVLIEMHKSLETSINSMIDFSSGFIPTYFYFEIKNQDNFIKSNEIIMDIEIISSIVLNTDIKRYIAKTLFSLLVKTSINVEDNFLNAKS